MTSRTVVCILESYFCVRSNVRLGFLPSLSHSLELYLQRVNLVMFLKINEDPVSTPASEWAEQTTSALGSSANEISSKPAHLNTFIKSTGANSTATTRGVNIPRASLAQAGPTTRNLWRFQTPRSTSRTRRRTSTLYTSYSSPISCDIYSPRVRTCWRRSLAWGRVWGSTSRVVFLTQYVCFSVYRPWATRHM